MRDEYDLFISHASEDKPFVRPLAAALRNKGLVVWYDEFSLRLGDSLRESIDHGLANSRHGVVVLSHDFFAKRWTRRELNAMFQRVGTGNREILPIWHRIDADDVARYAPMLADIKAIGSDQGVALVVDEILRAINWHEISSGPDLTSAGRDHEDRKVGLSFAWLALTVSIAAALILVAFITIWPTPEPDLKSEPAMQDVAERGQASAGDTASVTDVKEPSPSSDSATRPSNIQRSKLEPVDSQSIPFNSRDSQRAGAFETIGIPGGLFRVAKDLQVTSWAPDFSTFELLFSLHDHVDRSLYPYIQVLAGPAGSNGGRVAKSTQYFRSRDAQNRLLVELSKEIGGQPLTIALNLARLESAVPQVPGEEHSGERSSVGFVFHLAASQDGPVASTSEALYHKSMSETLSLDHCGAGHCPKLGGKHEPEILYDFSHYAQRIPPNALAEFYLGNRPLNEFQKPAAFQEALREVQQRYQKIASIGDMVLSTKLDVSTYDFETQSFSLDQPYHQSSKNRYVEYGPRIFTLTNISDVRWYVTPNDAEILLGGLNSRTVTARIVGHPTYTDTGGSGMHVSNVLITGPEAAKSLGNIVVPDGASMPFLNPANLPSAFGLDIGVWKADLDAWRRESKVRRCGETSIVPLCTQRMRMRVVGVQRPDDFLTRAPDCLGGVLFVQNVPNGDMRTVMERLYAEYGNPRAAISVELTYWKNSARFDESRKAYSATRFVWGNHLAKKTSFSFQGASWSVSRLYEIEAVVVQLANGSIDVILNIEDLPSAR